MPQAYKREGKWVKQCSKCRETKPTEEYHRCAILPDGLSFQCIACHRARRMVKPEAKAAMMASGIKRCCRCKETKPLEHFPESKHTNSGYSARCKPCCAIISKQVRDGWDEDKKRVVREQKRRDAYTDWAKRGKAKSHAKLMADPIRAAKRAEWYRTNYRKPEVRAARLAKEKERCATDMAYKMRRRLGCLTREFVEGHRKSGRSMRLLGCSPEEFKRHIESQWTEGMSWENHGGGKECWSLDHIVCCALFDPSQESHQHACMHYTNIRPMWHVDNVRKNDRLPDGRRAHTLSPEEKREALIGLGFGRLFEGQIAHAALKDGVT